MKITVDKSLPRIDPEEAEAVATEPSEEEFRKAMLEVKEFVFSEQVMEQLKEMGMTPDELVAMFLNKAKTSN